MNDIIEEYSRARAAEDNICFYRCKQDIACALGLNGETPPDWDILVKAVRQLKINLAAAQEEATEMQRWAEDAAYAENENAKELEAALLKLEGKSS